MIISYQTADKFLLPCPPVLLLNSEKFSRSFEVLTWEKFVRTPTDWLVISAKDLPAHLLFDCPVRQGHACLAPHFGHRRAKYDENWVRPKLPGVMLHKVKSPPRSSLGPVALQILAYLGRHRRAQDTLEGIAEWWMLEQRIRHVITEVQRALAELVAQGMVIERIGEDGRVHYRLNPQKRPAVDELLKEASDDSHDVPPESSVG